MNYNAILCIILGGLMSANVLAAEAPMSEECQKLDTVFAKGEINPYGKYFIGQSYLNIFPTQGVTIANITFEAGTRNNWHVHHATKGGGQILLVTAGNGWYQEWGKPAQALKKGDIIQIAANVKHWHGAAKDSCFAHLSIEPPAEGASNEWLEPVTDEAYLKL